MKTLKFKWVDAFTDQLFGGNPCAVVFDADDLSRQQMQTIAKEMNLSETAFILKSEKADFAARYFTPAEEIPLAGHPTISVFHSLLENRQIKGNDSNYSLELKAGVIKIEIKNDRVVMNQKKPEFLSTHDNAKIARIFGLNVKDIHGDFSVQTVSTGTPQLMVFLKNHEGLKKAKINVDEYVSYKAKSDFFSPHLFCIQGFTSQGDTSARHFGVLPDTAEDPFTGSATGGMAAYLWKHQILKTRKFKAEQGHWMERPGLANVEVVGPPDNIETVKISGPARTLIDGTISIP